MSKIYYLIHITSDITPIMKSKKLKVSTNFKDQFPGVYFSLVTSNNIDTESFFPGKHILIFSAKLLEQRNYHVNIQDHNGIISEKNTLFHWNLESNLSKFKGTFANPHSNEVVFHDDVPLSYLCKHIEKPVGTLTRDVLPRKVYVNSTPPDKKLLPFYNYCDYKLYTGIKTKYSGASSLRWFRMLAKVFEVSENGNILKQMERKQSVQHKDRHLQNIHHLIIYTTLHSQ